MHGVAAGGRLAKIEKSSTRVLDFRPDVNLQRFVLVRSDCQRQECEIVPVCKLTGRGTLLTGTALMRLEHFLLF